MMTRRIPAFLHTDPSLYVGPIQLYRRGTVRVLDEDPEGIFIQDTHGITYMLAASNAELAISWLKKHANEGVDLMMIAGVEIADTVQKELGLSGRMDVYQAIYEKDMPPRSAHRLKILPAHDSDAAFIRDHYSDLDEEELRQVILNRQLYLGYDEDGACVGFVGQHMEGSMGMLQVLPEHRRKGYGADLESFMIDRMLRQGLIPYCQFKIGNYPSRALQEKLGLKIVDRVITWLF